jgi:hypothetical protein
MPYKDLQVLHNICCDLRSYSVQKFYQGLSCIYPNLMAHINMQSRHPSTANIDAFGLPEILGIRKLFHSLLESMFH